MVFTNDSARKAVAQCCSTLRPYFSIQSEPLTYQRGLNRVFIYIYYFLLFLFLNFFSFFLYFFFLFFFLFFLIFFYYFYFFLNHKFLLLLKSLLFKILNIINNNKYIN